MLRISLFTAVLFGFSARAMDVRWPEGSARGFPAVVDPVSGKVLGRGTHTQLVHGHTLKVDLVLELKDGSFIEETDLLQLSPQLEQQSWTWSEKKNGEVIRSYSLDMVSGMASGFKMTGDKREDVSGQRPLTLGKAFAGEGFAFALKNLSEELSKGAVVELETVAFTPKPRFVKVKVRQLSEEKVFASGVPVEANHFVVEAQLPAIAKIFVKVPPVHLWFAKKAPPSFLQTEGPLQEISDPVVRIEAQSPAN